MAKIILLCVVAGAVYWILRAYAKSVARLDRRGKSKQAGRNGEDMVQCCQCGVYFPRGEAYESGGMFYCTEAHRRVNEP